MDAGGVGRMDGWAHGDARPPESDQGLAGAGVPAAGRRRRRLLGRFERLALGLGAVLQLLLQLGLLFLLLLLDHLGRDRGAVVGLAEVGERQRERDLVVGEALGDDVEGGALLHLVEDLAVDLGLGEAAVGHAELEGALRGRALVDREAHAGLQQQADGQKHTDDAALVALDLVDGERHRRRLVGRGREVAGGEAQLLLAGLRLRTHLGPIGLRQRLHVDLDRGVGVLRLALGRLAGDRRRGGGGLGLRLAGEQSPRQEGCGPEFRRLDRHGEVLVVDGRNGEQASSIEICRGKPQRVGPRHRRRTGARHGGPTPPRPGAWPRRAAAGHRGGMRRHVVGPPQPPPLSMISGPIASGLGRAAAVASHPHQHRRAGCRA